MHYSLQDAAALRAGHVRFGSHICPEHSLVGKAAAFLIVLVVAALFMTLMLNVQQATF